MQLFIMYDTAGQSAHQHQQYTTRHGHQQITWKDSILRSWNLFEFNIRERIEA
jgi:hypothetical protein